MSEAREKDNDKPGVYYADNVNPPTLFYDGTCKVCLSFVTKLERIVRPDVKLKFTPFGQVVNDFSVMAQLTL